jgi:diadenosine tetraphosphatase ApaH/serine/threonine PP2A family protein phosphatase
VETILRPAAESGSEYLEIDADCAYLVNPGSVGQPRDGDPRAGYVLYDSEANRVNYCRVGYDIHGAQKKIQDAGLPPILADRLSVGR